LLPKKLLSQGVIKLATAKYIKRKIPKKTSGTGIGHDEGKQISELRKTRFHKPPGRGWKVEVVQDSKMANCRRWHTPAGRVFKVRWSADKFESILKKCDGNEDDVFQIFSEEIKSIGQHVAHHVFMGESSSNSHKTTHFASTAKGLTKQGKSSKVCILSNKTDNTPAKVIPKCNKYKVLLQNTVAAEEIDDPFKADEPDGYDEDALFRHILKSMPRFLE